MTPAPWKAGAGETVGSDARREAVRQLIRRHRIQSQEQLRELLSAQGIEVTQATLSRDLARLKARRVTLPEGGSVYELDEPVAVIAKNEMQELGALVEEVREGDAMVVVHTRIGVASSVAHGLDRARMPEIIGTLAGDDTIFVAPGKGVRPARLKARLEEVFGLTTEEAPRRVARIR